MTGTTKQIHVVVVGAGFGGLQVVKKLANRKGIQVTVVDKTNHHLFQPLLYQVATAVLSPSDIAIPARSLTTKMPNVSVMMTEATNVDKEKKLLYCHDKVLPYDYLVLAMGARTSYFGHDQWAEFAPGLKSLADALRIRRNILLSFEQAELAEKAPDVASLLRCVIIGGGPTGVELAGSIAELAHTIIRKDFRRIDPATTEVVLIEAGPRLLPSFSPVLAKITKLQLEKRGVTVMLNAPVLNIDERGVHLQDRVIKAQSMIWAAGVETNPFASKLNVALDQAKRVIVNRFCALEEHPEIFVIGDMANFSEGLAHPLPGVSPVAMQQGRFVARTIVNDLKGAARRPFAYLDKGQMATIGRKDAIAEVGPLKLSGVMGWLAWLFVHLFYQVGFKNKVSILLAWVWSYLRFRAGARLIEDVGAQGHAASRAKLVLPVERV